MDDLFLSRTRAVVLLVDAQERLASAMDPAALERTLRAARLVLIAAQRLGLPVIATEQYPRGLGPTVAALAPLLERARRLEKMTFSSARADGFDDALDGRDQAIVVGMEAHVCVWQTVLDLRLRGLGVHVPRDAVVSRHREDYEAALGLYARAGAVVTTAETAVFQLLERAGTDELRALSKVIRSRGAP